ncbi:MAG TPA: response regulator [Patescibacteria group bacterium]|nr:response regulator [Patescibacteria group bacterium]
MDPQNKILLVEDDENIRLLYSEELKEEGYYVTAIPSDNRIMEKISSEIPDIIILDTLLKNDNIGYLLDNIKKQYPKLPVIQLISNGKGKKNVSALYAKIIKSLDLRELKSTISLLLLVRKT